MSGIPTDNAVSRTFRHQLEVDEEFASLNVFATTLASIGTLFSLTMLVT